MTLTRNLSHRSEAGTHFLVHPGLGGMVNFATDVFPSQTLKKACSREQAPHSIVPPFRRRTSSCITASASPLDMNAGRSLRDLADQRNRAESRLSFWRDCSKGRDRIFTPSVTACLDRFNITRRLSKTPVNCQISFRCIF